MVVIEDCFCAPQNDFLSFNIKLLFYVGLWPNKKWPTRKKQFYKLYEATLHILSLIFLVITAVGTCQHKDDITVFMTNLDKVLVGYNFVFKVMFFVVYREDVRDLVKEIIKSGDKVTKKTERLMITHVVVIISLATGLSGVFSVLAQLKGEMTVDAWMPFDPLKNRMNLLLAAQVLVITFVVPCILRGLSLQGIVCSLTMYLCDQLIELQNRIRSLKYVLEDEATMRAEFKKIIEKHVRLIRCATSMSKTFTVFFFIQNIAVTVELCLNALMVTTVGLNEKKLLASFLAFLCMALVNSYIYCYLGNEMIIQSEGIAQAAYEATWTSWPLEMQKELLIIITMAQKPMKLSAGGMAAMSITTYSQTLYNGYSIFAVLNDIVD